MAGVWKNLKVVKHAIKLLNTGTYEGLEDRIKHCIYQLQLLQKDMRTPGQSVEKIETERQLKFELEKWLNVEESIIRKKSRVQWLKSGDASTTFFFLPV